MQVRQAVRAVELFQKHYLRHLKETGTEVPAAVAGQVDATEKPKTFAAALDETRTLIRLRHYAYRTEQTYLEWLRRYNRFADKGALPWEAADTARSFLADLAIHRGVAAATQNQAFIAILFPTASARRCPYGGANVYVARLATPPQGAYTCRRSIPYLSPHQST